MAKKLFLISVDSESDFCKSLESFLQENQQLDNALCVDVSCDEVMLSSKNQSISLLHPAWKQNHIKDIDELERRYKYRGLYGSDS